MIRKARWRAPSGWMPPRASSLLPHLSPAIDPHESVARGRTPARPASASDTHVSASADDGRREASSRQVVPTDRAPAGDVADRLLDRPTRGSSRCADVAHRSIKADRTHAQQHCRSSRQSSFGGLEDGARPNLGWQDGFVERASSAIHRRPTRAHPFSRLRRSRIQTRWT
jgi:hypothetical protein